MRKMTFDNRAHKMDYKSWHKCTRCNTFTLFNDAPEKTIGACPDCWELWKDIPQYRTTKKMRGIRIKKRPAKNKVNEVPYEWPVEFMLLYLLGCSLCLFVVTYYLWIA